MGVDKTVNVMEQRSHNYVTLHAKGLQMSSPSTANFDLL